MTFDPRIVAARGDLADIALAGRVPAERYAAGKLMEVSRAIAPLRRQPAHEAQLDTELLFGERFMVFEEKNDWAWGQSQTDSYVGYVPADRLAPASIEPTHAVFIPATWLFSEPNTKAPPRMRLSQGSRLSVLSTSGYFAEVKTHVGRAFALIGHLRKIGAFTDDFVRTAERWAFIPFLWSGRSSIGLDCSAFVQLSLAEAGVKTPRDSDLQRANVGELLGDGRALGEMKRGDLVFWKSHASIAVDAKRIIHANVLAMAVTVDDAATFAKKVEPDAGPILAIRRPKP